MNDVKADLGLIAYCGLYCGECPAYKKEKCPGCHTNEKAKWCKIRTCNMEHGYKSCAECTAYANPMDCKSFNNIFSKFFAFVFRSNRPACIAMIKEQGYEKFALYMVQNKQHTIKR
jgi:hypothetical protein